MGASLIEEFREARARWPFIDAVEKRAGLPPRMLYAVGWRETKLQNIMGDFSQRSGESSPRFHGFGVWQRDSDAFGVDASYLKSVRRQARDAASLLAANFAIFGDWPAAVAAYNCGPGNVRKALDKGLGVDHFTAHGNYSADVLATRALLVKGRVPKADLVADPRTPPPQSFFKVGKEHPSFTLMGERFLIWLKKGIRHDGNGYQPGPVFTVFDQENVALCQQLMGDEPDGWFGPAQWERLMTQRPPKPAHVGAVPVTGLRRTQEFGRKNPAYKAKEHTGVDFGSSGDDTIRSVADGTCVRSSFDRDGWGHYVIVQHDDGDRFSWYCHMTHRAVSVGDRVERGQELGVMGSTGNSRGKHLHYQESVGGTGYFDYTRPIFVDPG